MLSGETSVGSYPIETVETMARIISSTERHGMHRMAPIDWQPRTKGGVIAKAAVEVAHRVDAKYLVAFTQSGDSPGGSRATAATSRCWPSPPSPRSGPALALSWGIETFLTSPVEHTDEMVRQVDEHLLKIGRVQEGDLVVLIAGSPGHPRLHQRDAGSPDGRRDQRGGAGVPSPDRLTRRTPREGAPVGLEPTLDGA